MSTVRVVAMLAALWFWAPHALTEEAKTARELFESMPSKAALQEEDGRKFKLYEYEGEKFKVFEPKDGRMDVEGLELTGAVYVHHATGRYRGEALGWGTVSDSPKDALDSACRQILKRAGRPKDEDLRKGLEELYDSLD